MNHFRVGVLFGDTETGPDAFRAPIMEGDFYVDEKNSSEFWKVLHFGFQNLLDPALDEWAVMEKLDDAVQERSRFPRSVKASARATRRRSRRASSASERASWINLSR